MMSCPLIPLDLMSHLTGAADLRMRVRLRGSRSWPITGEHWVTWQDAVPSLVAHLHTLVRGQLEDNLGDPRVLRHGVGTRGPLADNPLLVVLANER